MAVPYSRGLAAGDLQYPRGSGLEDTFFRPLAPDDSQGVLEVPSATHPYLRFELLTKIFNQSTTRSNVFAVWVTVGFFEVTDDRSRPVKLGAEIGRAESRHVRHRMFAVVDRTNLTRSPGRPPVFLKARTGVVETAPVQATVAVDALQGTYEKIPWKIEKGTKLLVDLGPSQEVVTVLRVDPRASPPTFTAVFQEPHPADCVLTLNAVPGNPGPQARYDPRWDSAVVRYMSIIR